MSISAGPYGASDAYSYLTRSGVKVIPSGITGTETFQRSSGAADPDRSTGNTAPRTARPSFTGPRAIRSGPRTVQATRRDTLTYRVRPFESFDSTVKSIASMVPADRAAAIRAVAEYWARECESLLTRSERIHYAERLTAEHSHLASLPKSQRIRAWLTGQLIPIVRASGRTSAKIPAGWDLTLSPVKDSGTVPDPDRTVPAPATVKPESPESVAYRLHVNGADHSAAHCALCH